MSDIRYKRLAYVALRVSDIERSMKFYREIVGLDEGAPSVNGVHFLRCGNDHHNMIVRQGDGPEIERVAFEVESLKELDKAKAYIAALGIDVVEVDADELAVLHQGRSIRFTEPNTELTIELIESMEALPHPYQPTVSKIERLGHVVIGTKNRAEAIRFFIEHMNFRMSDEVGEWVSFMRCFPNPFHHSFAISGAPVNRLHHVNFMVSDLDDIGTATHRLRRNDVPIVFGPGRHPPSGSVFLYFLDPDGMTFEYSYGMEEFPETGERGARVLPPSVESFDFWGGEPPDPRFANVGRIVPAVAHQS